MFAHGHMKIATILPSDEVCACVWVSVYEWMDVWKTHTYEVIMHYSWRTTLFVSNVLRILVGMRASLMERLAFKWKHIKYIRTYLPIKSVKNTVSSGMEFPEKKMSQWLCASVLLSGGWIRCLDLVRAPSGLGSGYLKITYYVISGTHDRDVHDGAIFRKWIVRCRLILCRNSMAWIWNRGRQRGIDTHELFSSWYGARAEESDRIFSRAGH